MHILGESLRFYRETYVRISTILQFVMMSWFVLATKYTFYTDFTHIFQIPMLLLLNLCLNLDHFAVCDDEMICFGNEIYILHRFHTYFSNFYTFIAKLVSESWPFCSLWWWVDLFWQPNIHSTQISHIFFEFLCFYCETSVRISTILQFVMMRWFVLAMK